MFLHVALRRNVVLTIWIHHFKARNLSFIFIPHTLYIRPLFMSHLYKTDYVQLPAIRRSIQCGRRVEKWVNVALRLSSAAAAAVAGLWSVTSQWVLFDAVLLLPWPRPAITTLIVWRGLGLSNLFAGVTRFSVTIHYRKADIGALWGVYAFADAAGINP